MTALALEHLALQACLVALAAGDKVLAESFLQHANALRAHQESAP
jgi:hypothetical protein